MLYRKFRRPAGVLLAIMLTLATLAGCSATDAGYVSMLMETSKLDSYTFTGDLSFELDPDALYVNGGSEPIKIDMDMSGSVIQSGEDLYVDCKIKYGVNDRKKPNEMNFKMVGLEFFIPVKDLIEAVEVGYRFEGFSDKMRSDLAAALERELAEYDHLIFDYAEAPGTADLLAVSTGDKAAEAGELIVKSLTKMLGGLNSGMTKKIDGGYSLEITPDKGLVFADKLVKFVGDNKQQIYKEAIKLLQSLEKIYGDEIIDIGDYDEQDFYEMIDYFTSVYANMSDFDKEALLLAFKGSRIKDSLTKSGASYNQAFDWVIKYQDSKLFSMKGQLTYTKAAVEIEAADGEPIDPDTFGMIVERVAKQINHAKEISIAWWNGAYSDWTSMNITRLEGIGWDHAERIIESGALHLPIRTLCEWFAEEVEWDNSAKKAYVNRGGELTEMTGKLEGRVFFVRVRDFEKLGYTVDYEYDAEWGEHKVTLKKN